jgi:ribosomal protein S18 acetylase RimI-like enzyme
MTEYQPVRRAPLVRRARTSDASAITNVHILSSEDAYAPLAAVWPAVDMVARTAFWTKTLSEGAAVFVAEDADASVVGFGQGGPARRTMLGAEVEVWVLHVLPGCRGRGIGDALWAAICREARGPELLAMYVETLAELACCSFYERHGGAVGLQWLANFHGVARTHVAYVWPRGVASELRRGARS